MVHPLTEISSILLLEWLDFPTFFGITFASVTKNWDGFKADSSTKKRSGKDYPGHCANHKELTKNWNIYNDKNEQK